MTAVEKVFAIIDGELPSAALARADTPQAKRAAGQYALSLTEVPGLAHPVPRLMLDIPWANDNDAIVEDILLGIITTDDIGAATAESEVAKAPSLVGQVVTIEAVTARRSDLEDATWGAYLLLTVTDAEGNTFPVACGGAQVVVTVWRLAIASLLPARGQFVLLGSPSKGRNQPVGFRYEPAF